jgi:prophage regulatory protein
VLTTILPLTPWSAFLGKFSFQYFAAMHSESRTATESASMTSTPLLASAKVLSKRYSVSTATVWRWSAEGRIPKPLKLSQKITRWRVAECDAALAARGAA